MPRGYPDWHQPVFIIANYPYAPVGWLQKRYWLVRAQTDFLSELETASKERYTEESTSSTVETTILEITFGLPVNQASWLYGICACTLLVGAYCEPAGAGGNIKAGFRLRIRRGESVIELGYAEGDWIGVSDTLEEHYVGLSIELEETRLYEGDRLELVAYVKGLVTSSDYTLHARLYHSPLHGDSWVLLPFAARAKLLE